jgi:hypothetical protein
MMMVTVADLLAGLPARSTVVSACERKTRYASEYKARLTGHRTLQGKVERGENAPRRLYAYGCPVCRGWHLSKITYSRIATAITASAMWEGVQ